MIMELTKKQIDALKAKKLKELKDKKIITK